MAKKASKSPKPTNPKLYARVKAEAKRKFDVYPVFLEPLVEAHR